MRSTYGAFSVGHRRCSYRSLLLYVATTPLISYYNSRVEIHSAAPKHGIADADIDHAVDHAMTIENQDDDTRLYLAPARSAALLEVVTVVRDDGSEIAIHAMGMRAKYQRLLPGG